MKQKTGRFLFSLISTVAVLMVLFCERFQFFSLSSGRVRLECAGCAAAAFAFFYFLLFPKLAHRIGPLTGKSRLCWMLLAAVGSVCLMTWFSFPQTGIRERHTLRITLPENEPPVTLTWFHSGDRDLSFSQFSGDGIRTEQGLELAEGGSSAEWRGIADQTAVLEFAAGTDRGRAVLSWDGSEREISLYSGEMERLSFEQAFPPSLGLPEFLSWFWLLALVLYAGMAWFFGNGFSFKPQLVFPLLFLLFAVLRFAQFRTAEAPLTFVDSESYLGTSLMSVSEILKGTPFCYPEADLWYCISRPALIPLLYKLLRQDLNAIALFQLLFSIIAWGFFACCTQRVLNRPRLKLLGMILILGLGCIPNVARWDLMIMTESITISLSVIFLASLLLLTDTAHDSGKGMPALLAILSGILMIPTRDSSVWLVLESALLLAALGTDRRIRRPALTAAACLAVFSLVTMLRTDDRWQYPFENVIFSRILRDPEATEYFVSAGMPMPEGIETLYGAEHLQGSELFNSEPMRPLREWILSDGLKTYIGYMLRTPMQTLRMSWHHFEKDTFEEIEYTFTPFGFHSLLPDSVIKFFSFNLPGISVILLGLCGMVRAFHEKNGAVYAFPVLFLLTAYLLVSAVLIIDTYDFSRHAIVNVILLKASAWLIGLLMLDRRSDQRFEPFL